MNKKSTDEKQQMVKKSRRIRLLFTGFVMGMADLVPGVSGGTIAFLFGIYDELLYSIKVVTGKVPPLLLKGNFREAFKIIPFTFLVPLFLGIFTAIFGLVHIFSYLLETQPLFVWSVFFGLVIGSVYVVSKRVSGWNRNRIGLLLLGALITYIIVGLPTLSGVGSSPIVLLLTGMIASSAMILPGISGSLIMVILGQYEHVIDAVADRDFLFLGFFALGAVLGLALLARLLSWLLHNHHSAVVAFLIGVMIGSLRKVWPWQVQVDEKLFVNTTPQADWTLVACLLLMAGGFLIVTQLERFGIAKEHVDIEDKDFKQEVKSQHD